MPIDTTDIDRLAQILERSGVASIEIEENGQSLKLVMETGKSTASLLAAPTETSYETATVAKADVAGRGHRRFNRRGGRRDRRLRHADRKLSERRLEPPDAKLRKQPHAQ